MSESLATKPHSIDLADLFCKLQEQLLAKQNLVRTAVPHPGTKGDASELNWLELLRDYLPKRYRVEKAFLVDSSGTLSQQQDIVIFDRQYSPFILNESGAIYVPAESVYAIIEVKQELNREQIRLRAAPLIHKYETILGVSLRRLYVRQMKTRWGTCNHERRTIRLNTELAKKPVECLEYIVLHELAHLIEPTHNARFKGLVQLHMPNWELRRQALNRLPVRHESWTY